MREAKLIYCALNLLIKGSATLLNKVVLAILRNLLVKADSKGPGSWLWKTAACSLQQKVHLLKCGMYSCAISQRQHDWTFVIFHCRHKKKPLSDEKHESGRWQTGWKVKQRVTRAGHFMTRGPVLPLMLSVAVERCPFSGSNHQHQVHGDLNRAVRCS